MTQKSFNLVKDWRKYWKVLNDKYVFSDGWFYPNWRPPNTHIFLPLFARCEKWDIHGKGCFFLIALSPKTKRTNKYFFLNIIFKDIFISLFNTHKKCMNLINLSTMTQLILLHKSKEHFGSTHSDFTLINYYGLS